MNRPLKTNDSVNRDAASVVRSPETKDGVSAASSCSFSAIGSATKGLEYVSAEKELVDQLVELIGQSPTPELVLVDVLWKVKTIKAFDRVGHMAMEYFTDLPRKILAKAH